MRQSTALTSPLMIQKWWDYLIHWRVGWTNWTNCKVLNLGWINPMPQAGDKRDGKQLSWEDLEILKLKRSLQCVFLAKATNHVHTVSTGMLPTVQVKWSFSAGHWWDSTEHIWNAVSNSWLLRTKRRYVLRQVQQALQIRKSTGNENQESGLGHSGEKKLEVKILLSTQPTERTWR